MTDLATTSQTAENSPSNKMRKPVYSSLSNNEVVRTEMPEPVKEEQPNPFKTPLSHYKKPTESFKQTEQKGTDLNLQSLASSTSSDKFK